MKKIGVVMDVLRTMMRPYCTALIVLSYIIFVNTQLHAIGANGPRDIWHLVYDSHNKTETILDKVCDIEIDIHIVKSKVCDLEEAIERSVSCCDAQDSRLDALESELENISFVETTDTRIDALVSCCDAHDSRLDNHDTRIEDLESCCDAQDSRLDRLESLVDEMESAAQLGGGAIFGGTCCVLEKCATLDNIAFNSPINFTADWSYDHNYIAYAEGSVLKIVFNTGFDLQVVQSLDLTNEITDLKWSPTEHRLVVSRFGLFAGELYTIEYDPQANSLTILDTESYSLISGVAWHPSGDCIVITRSNEIILLSVDNAGMMSPVITTNTNSGGSVNTGALDFNGDGTRLAFGLNTASNNLEIWTIDKNYPSLQFDATITMSVMDGAAGVGSVAWNPTLEVNSSEYLAVALTSTNSSNIVVDDTLKVLSYKGSFLTVEAFVTDMFLDARRVDWSVDGSCLAVGYRNINSTDGSLRNYDFNPYGGEVSSRLLLISIFDGIVYHVKWAPDSALLLATDDTGYNTGDITTFRSICNLKGVMGHLLSCVDMLKTDTGEIRTVVISSLDELTDKVCDIESILDNLSFNCSNIDIIIDNGPVLTKLCDIESILDNIQIDVDFGLLESKICAIDSKLSDLDVNVDLSLVTSKLCALEEMSSSCVDIQLETMSKVCDIDGQIKGLNPKVNLILTKVCDIEYAISDIDNFNVSTADMLETIESKVCAIDEKIDIASCGAQPLSSSNLPITITSAGLYVLTEDYVMMSAAPIITVSGTQDVIIDLCGKRLSGGVSGVTGVTVAASQENITVKNGTIASVDYGIVAAEDVSKMMVEDICIFESARSAIQYNGVMGSPVTNSVIKNTLILRSVMYGASDPDDAVILLSYGKQVEMYNCMLNNNGIGLGNGIDMRNCVNCQLHDIRMQCNDGTDVALLRLIDTTNSFFNKMEISGNTASSHIYGIEIGPRADNNRFVMCEVRSNQATGDALGFFVHESSGNTFHECVASNQSGTFGVGIYLQDVLRSIFVRSIASCNSDDGVSAAENSYYGASVMLSEFKDCQAMYNGRYGFNLAGADTSITMIRNIACGNGSK